MKIQRIVNDAGQRAVEIETDRRIAIFPSWPWDGKLHTAATVRDDEFARGEGATVAAALLALDKDFNDVPV